jgi:hypothetical protein
MDDVERSIDLLNQRVRGLQRLIEAISIELEAVTRLLSPARYQDYLQIVAEIREIARLEAEQAVSDAAKRTEPPDDDGRQH